MEESSLAIILLMLGLALLVAEVFIPSGGAILAASLISLGCSIWFAWKAWWESNQLAFWMYSSSLALLLPVCIIGAFYLFPRTSLGRRFLLEGPAPEEVRAYAQEQDRLRALIGRLGKTLTLLNPGGLVIVEGERLHCESEGVVIDIGEPVVVVGVIGNRLVVRQSDRAVEAQPSDGRNLTAADQSQLDFDVPQG